MYACYNCGHLNKSKKKRNENGCYNYGCDACDWGYTIGDMKHDAELKTQGCSDWIDQKQKYEQLSLFA
jgi:predicted  nucleic acid-binding Zn-ribbon protein